MSRLTAEEIAAWLDGYQRPSHIPVAPFCAGRFNRLERIA
jgi:hypothetical protein